tara:strand:- start:79 stop:264 length:186 start_codon:yes stop_codon:yes gene_type:complete
MAKIYKHLKSGGTYKVLGTDAHLEQEGLEGSLYVVYQNVTDGIIWIRDQNEFFDGRFKELN